MAGKGKEDRLDSLLTGLEPVLAEIDRREGISISSRPYAPATEAEIAAAEKRLKFKFPPSYREFLHLHNGWDRFNAGDIYVLGVSGPAYKKALEQWKRDLGMFEKILRRKGRSYAQELSEKSKDDPKVILVSDHTPVATNYNGDWWVFDHNRKSEDGEYEVARVAHGQYVEDREKSFRAFVEDNVRRKQAELRKLGGDLEAIESPAKGSESKKSGTRQGPAAAGKKGRGGKRASTVRGKKTAGEKAGKTGTT